MLLRRNLLQNQNLRNKKHKVRSVWHLAGQHDTFTRLWPEVKGQAYCDLFISYTHTGSIDQAMTIHRWMRSASDFSINSVISVKAGRKWLFLTVTMRLKPQTLSWLSTEVTKVRRNLFNQEMVSPSKKAKLPRSQSVSAVEGLKRKRSHPSQGENTNFW